jgi:hypothetical protein
MHLWTPAHDLQDSGPGLGDEARPRRNQLGETRVMNVTRVTQLGSACGSDISPDRDGRIRFGSE